MKKERLMQHIVFGFYTVGASCFVIGTVIGWWQFVVNS